MVQEAGGHQCRHLPLVKSPDGAEKPAVGGIRQAAAGGLCPVQISRYLEGDTQGGMGNRSGAPHEGDILPESEMVHDYAFKQKGQDEHVQQS